MGGRFGLLPSRGIHFILEDNERREMADVFQGRPLISNKSLALSPNTFHICPSVSRPPSAVSRTHHLLVQIRNYRNKHHKA
jgi:hypothetical protein